MSGPNARREFGIARCVDGFESGDVGGLLDHVSRGGAEANGAAACLGGAATVTDGGAANDAATGADGLDGELCRPGGLPAGAFSRSISPSRRFRRQCVHRTTESRISPPQCGQVFT
jgi:hypothetical protein